MPCHLDYESLEALWHLQRTRKVSEKHALPEDDFKKWFQDKLNKKKFNKNFDDVILRLQTEAYITERGGTAAYYIDDKPKAFWALGKHQRISPPKYRPR